MSDTTMQPTQSTMKAIALDRFGGLETMKLQMLPVPEVGPDEVLIHVEWAGVGKWDPFEREGGFAKAFGIEPKFPYVLGSDGAGTVAAVAVDIDLCGLNSGGGGGFSRCAMVASWIVFPVNSPDAAVRSAGAEQLGRLLPDCAEGVGRSDLGPAP